MNSYGEQQNLINESKPLFVRSHDIQTDAEYIRWLSDIKQRYRSTQIKAALRINSEQLLFYWQLGRDLVIRRAEEKWGKGIVEQVSLDLRSEFPNVKGFSTSNLWYMKKWYLFFERDAEKVMRSSAEIMEHINPSLLHQIGGENITAILHRDSGEMPFPALFSLVSWRHHVNRNMRANLIFT